MWQLSAQIRVEAKLGLGARKPVLDIALYLLIGRIVGEAESAEIAANDPPTGSRDPDKLVQRFGPSRDPLK